MLSNATIRTFLRHLEPSSALLHVFLVNQASAFSLDRGYQGSWRPYFLQP